MSTLAVVKRETKSWKWPIIQFVMMTGLLIWGVYWCINYWHKKIGFSPLPLAPKGEYNSRYFSLFTIHFMFLPCGREY
jgi:hypothetical protein